MRLASAIVLLLVVSSSAVAQPYCALREPVTGIFNAFPEATSYRSITRTLTPDHRRAIAERLPFTLHFNELGRHTVYLAFKDGRPLGLVHVRSERGRYGLVEIGWILGIDLRVKDVYFQRCRDDRAHAALERLAPHLRGAWFNTLKAELPGAKTEEERMLLQSGLKTLAATWGAWGDAVVPHQARLIAESAFGEVSAVRPRPLERSVFDTDALLEVDTSSAWAVTAPGGDALGVVVRLDWRPNGHLLDLWWVVRADGTVDSIRRADGRVDETCARLLDSFSGRSAEELEHCTTAAGVIAAQVLESLGPPEPTPP